MGEQPDIDEIREEQRGGNNGGDGGGDGGADDGGDGGTGMFDGGIPTFGLSRKQLLIIGLVVAAAIAWKLRSDGDAGGRNARSEVESIRDTDLGDVEVEEDDDAEDVTVVVPANPDDELEKDEAVIEHLKDAGHIEGDGD